LYAVGLFQLRYYIVPAIGFYLLIGYSISGLASVKIRLALVTLLLAISINSLGGLINYPVTRWEEAMNYIAASEKEGDVIISTAFISLLNIDYYYPGNLKMATVVDDDKNTGDLLLTSVKNNYYPMAGPNSVRQLEELTSRSQRVFLVYTPASPFSASQELVKDWFFENGWNVDRKSSIFKNGDNGDIQVLVLEKNNL
jgi:hypothetical protein